MDSSNETNSATSEDETIDLGSPSKNASYRYQDTLAVSYGLHNLVNAITSKKLQNKKPQVMDEFTGIATDVSADNLFSTLHNIAQHLLLATIQNDSMGQLFTSKPAPKSLVKRFFNEIVSTFTRTEYQEFKESEQIIAWMHEHLNLTKSQQKMLAELDVIKTSIRNLPYALMNKDAELKGITKVIDDLTNDLTNENIKNKDGLEAALLINKKKLKLMLQEWIAELQSLEIWISCLDGFDEEYASIYESHYPSLGDFNANTYKRLSGKVADKLIQVRKQKEDLNAIYKLDNVVLSTKEDASADDYNAQAQFNYFIEVIFYRVKEYLKHNQGKHEVETDSNDELDREVDFFQLVSNTTKHAIMQHFKLKPKTTDIPSIKNIQGKYPEFFKDTGIEVDAKDSFPQNKKKWCKLLNTKLEELVAVEYEVESEEAQRSSNSSKASSSSSASTTLYPLHSPSAYAVMQAVKDESETVDENSDQQQGLSYASEFEVDDATFNYGNEPPAASTSNPFLTSLPSPDGRHRQQAQQSGALLGWLISGMKKITKEKEGENGRQQSKDIEAFNQKQEQKDERGSLSRSGDEDSGSNQSVSL